MKEIKERSVTDLVYLSLYCTAVVLISYAIIYMLPESLRKGYVMLALVIVIGFAPLLIMDYKSMEK